MLKSVATAKKQVVKKARPARGKRRREEIIRTAAAVLREQRTGPLRLERVAARLGLVPGNIYYYFENRQDLIFHCHLRCIEMDLEALEANSGSAQSAEQRLRAILGRHIEIIIGSEYGGALLADLDELSPAQRRRYVALRDRFEHGIRALIREGIEAGEFRETNESLAGFAILGSINWMPKWHRPEGKLPVRDISQWFVDFFVRALRS